MSHHRRHKQQRVALGLETACIIHVEDIGGICWISVLSVSLFRPIPHPYTTRMGAVSGAGDGGGGQIRNIYEGL